MTLLSVLNVAVLSAIVGCGFLFRREYNLVDQAIREKIVLNFSLKHTIYLWLQVKILSYFNGGKAPADVFDEYYGRKVFIQANVTFWFTGLVWGIGLIAFLYNNIVFDLPSISLSFPNSDSTDDIWFIVISASLLLIGHYFSSQLRHYIVDYQSKTKSHLREAEGGLYQFGVSASYEGKIEMPKNDNEPVLSRESLSYMREALETPEKSLKLLQELGLVDMNGDTAEPYRSNQSHRN